MPSPRLAGTACLAALLGCAGAPTPPTRPGSVEPPAPEPLAPAVAPRSPAAAPVARRQPTVDTIHDHRRVDDYAWMRRKDAPELLAYLKAENAHTEGAMRATGALQSRLYREMLARSDDTDLGVAYRKGPFIFYSRNEPGKPYPVQFRQKRGKAPREEILLDPNPIAGRESFAGLGPQAISPDGRLLAYTVDTTGLRDYTLFIKDIQEGQLLPDRRSGVVSAEWLDDSKTLYYVTRDGNRRPHRLWRHRLGSDPRQDELIYEEKDGRFELMVSRTRSDRFLLVTSRSHTTSEVRTLLASDPAALPRLIAPRTPDVQYEVDHRGDLFYIRSNDTGPNYRLVTAPLTSPGRARWRELIPHRDEVILERVDVFQDFYALHERQGGLSHLRLVRFAAARGDVDGRVVAIDEPVYTLWPHANPEFEAISYRYRLSSFVTPETVYEVDARSGTRTLLRRRAVQGGYDASRYQQERRFAIAPDGTRVPISLLALRGTTRDGRSPLLLTGYGAYGFSSDVAFDPRRFSLVDRGVTIAIAHVRGGGELGQRWHDAGRVMNKRNSFTDFITCAELLLADRYTSLDRLAIAGGRAGGLLVAAVINMRPDLFRVAVAQFPLVDLVNTMLDDSLPLTVAEFEEWGNPRNRERYDYIASYSPYDNVAARDYPSLLVTSSYQQSEAVYVEPARWVAKLRAFKTDHNPLLLRTDLDPPAAGPASRDEQLRESAFVTAFLLTQLRVPEPVRSVSAATASGPAYK